MAPTAHPVDVVVRAPAAVSGLRVPRPGDTNHVGETAQDIIRSFAADNDRLRADLRQLGDACSSIASVCLGLVRMLLDDGHGSPFAPNRVDIPRHLHAQLVGCTIRVGEDAAGNVTAELIHGPRERIVTGE